jgi:hypothetical protein
MLREVNSRMLVLGVPVEKIRAFGSTWSDGGLWDDILWLADQAWTAPDDGERRMRWHHLVMAVGNFKRQNGRRLRPARIAVDPVASLAASRDRFCVPEGPEVICDDAESWARLEQSLDGAAAATTTTLLAALWPDSHHILDWRVLAAVTGLGILAGGGEDLGLAEAGSRNQLQPTLDQYAKVRALLTRVGNQAGVPVTMFERALYLMSRAVQGKGMTWSEYGTALAAAVPTPSRAGNDGTPDDEQEVPPEAP